MTRTRLAASPIAALTFILFSCPAPAAVTDNQVPLNYNFHGLAHTSEAVTNAAASNADAIQFRSIADRGLYWDHADAHAFGTNPIVGATGITYGLYDALGYGNETVTTPANAVIWGLDFVHLGERGVWNRVFDTNTTTTTGPFPLWEPDANTNRDHTGDQVTVLSSPVTVDATTEIGLLYTVSDGGGQFDVVLRFNNGATDTDVTVRVAAPDWFGNSTDPIIVSSLVTSQSKITHTVSGTTYTTFRAVMSNDSGNLQTFSTTNAGPNLNVIEAIVSVGKIIAAGNSVAGQQLTRVTFRNATYGITALTAVSGNSGTSTTTCTVGSTSGYVAGQPISIAGVSPATFNGTYAIASVLSGTQFTFTNSTNGAGSAAMYANGQTLSSLTGNGTTVTGTTSAAHGFTVGQNVTISGAFITVSGSTAHNGTFLIASVPTSTTFTYANATSGTDTAQRQVSRLGVGRGYSIYAATVRNGSPSNTNCATPQVVASGDTVVPAGTFLHVPSGASPTACGGGNDTNPLWFSYTATGNNDVEARTCGASFDTTLAVYATCGGAAIACNDDGCGVASRARWTATQNTTYRIRVAGKNNAAGSFTLHIDDPAHTDLTMPLQFNWNGICNGTTPPTPNYEWTLPSSGATVGQTHENRYDQNGYRSIADRGLLADGSAGTINLGGTVGYQGILYQVYNTELQSDMVYLGDRRFASGSDRNFSPAGTTWPAEGGVSTSDNGVPPLWLNNIDQTGTQTSSMSGLSAVFGANTKVALIYHASNVESTAPFATFDVTLTFTDSTSVTVRVTAVDWFWSNAAALPGAVAGSGLEAQTLLGTFRAVDSTDRARDVGADQSGGWLRVFQAVISTASLQAMTPTPFNPTGKTLASIAFGNPNSNHHTAYPNGSTAANYSAFGIYAATLRDPASFNLNFPPTGIGTVTPNNLIAGSTGKMKVTVTRGSGIPNNITSVVVDASSVGLSSTFALNDSGTNGDVTPNDGVWSANISFPVNTSPGGFSLPFDVTDAQSRHATGNIIFSIVSPTGGVTPNAVVVGSPPRLTVTMSTNGAATPNIASVTVDASPLGLSSALALNDSGANGDTTANDGVYSANMRVPLDAPIGPQFLGFTVTDAQSNTFGGTLPQLTVNPPVVAATPSQGFAGSTTKFTVNLALNGIKATNITSVIVDATPFNLANNVALNDSGNNGDVSANDGIWSVDLAVPANASPGQVTLNTTITDASTSIAGSAQYTVLSVVDLGTLGNGVTNYNDFLNIGGVLWVKFKLAGPVTPAALRFLDIDSEGSTLTGGATTNDTMIGLYDATGSLVAFDDDDGSDNLSQLTFGATSPARSAVGNGAAYDGRDGPLTAVNTYYYLALSGYPTTFNPAGFSVATTSTANGSFNLNLALGTIPAGGVPGSFTDLGSIGTTPVASTQPLTAGGVTWFKLVVPALIDGNNPARKYLDIDTEGSAISNTVIGLFRDDGSGTLVAADDDDGSGTYSQLTFGRGTRPAVGDGLPYDGRDGLATITAGTYYLAVAEHAASFGNNFTVFFLTGTDAANVTVNIRSGFQPPILYGADPNPVINPANGHRYYLLDRGFLWTDAEAFAVSLGGHLATINDAAENEWVRTNVLEFDAADRRGWIGYTDQASEGNFVWIDGENPGYTNWNAGEPNNANGVENYAEMLGSTGLWNDLPNAGNPDWAIVEAVVGPAHGDMDCDGDQVLDLQDVSAFILGLVNPASYAIQYPGCDPLHGDFNNDGHLDGLDIPGMTHAIAP